MPHKLVVEKKLVEFINKLWKQRKNAKNVSGAIELVKAMKSHRCKGKDFVSDDFPPLLLVGYKCAGCGWQVQVRITELKIERDLLRLFWKAVKTQKGRIAFGKTLNTNPQRRKV